MPNPHHAGIQPWESALAVLLMLVAFLYMRGWVRIRRRETDPVGGWRATSLLAGLFAIWLAVASPISALDHEMLTFHMVQHLLLMTVAPPLIWLGTPAKPLMMGLPRRFAESMAKVFRLTAVRRAGAVIAHPAVCWLAASAVLIGWHIPFLFSLGMRSDVLHGLEQTSFFLAGLLFWWPVIHPWPSATNTSSWAILLYLFLATLPCDILSGFLVFCDRVVYPVYSSAPQSLGLSSLEDQECAGALMWTCVTVVYLIAGWIFAWRLLSPTKMREARVTTSGQQPAVAIREAADFVGS